MRINQFMSHLDQFIVLKILDLIFKLRPEPEVEDVGLDTFEIGVEAYPEFK